MRPFPHAKLIGLVLALFLAAPAAFCWDCCCSAEPASVDVAAAPNDAHACCAKPATDPDAAAMSPAAHCDCSAFFVEPAAEPISIWASTREMRDAPGSTVADLSVRTDASPSLSHSRLDALEPPPPRSVFRFSSVAPRAPPTPSV